MKVFSSTAKEIQVSSGRSHGGEKRGNSSRFSFSCGCKDSKSISISEPSEKSTRTPPRHREILSSVETPSSTSPSLDEEIPGSPSFSGLLRQLNDLEQRVRSWGPATAEEPRHRRCRSEGGGRLGESVAVVKESEDPLGDFRRSMLHMIVEKEIVGGDELSQLVDRFISLNSPRHHDLILRAFADICADVFSNYKLVPDLLRRSTTAPAQRRR
ncbi:hypothetical protein J5N97_024777 [Dioscorea zingiberensis]|uniref:Transcription repressor n=1 Tax=Dioscorea zingiberensis TaxID=325984 RepID=A0A9D5H995_9LILI|nr:hypothetical protein J5N97_024777 [Dioscorea zingiberensis]